MSDEMNEMRQMIADTADRIFRDLCEPDVVNAAEKGTWPADLWNTIEESGMTHIAIAEENGGGGGTIGMAMAVLRAAGTYSAPLPLAETMLGGVALASAGQAIPAGPLGFALPAEDESVSLSQSGDNYVLNGAVAAVAWAIPGGQLVVVADMGGQPVAALVDADKADIEASTNLAGEPRNNVTFSDAIVSACGPLGNDVTPESLFKLGALARSIQMAGALENMLEMTVQYTLDRVQFGRPIAKFQAVQHSLAVIAGEVAAAKTAADMAVHMLEAGDPGLLIESAKARTSEAAGVAAELAHQAHGAIGFTHEHNLHHRTRRLWSWREEYGTEFYWQRALGRAAKQSGGEGLWRMISGT
jgi:acyl-CoA dehydrogenase